MTICYILPHEPATFGGRKVAEIDWDEDATLYLQLSMAGGTATTRALQFGPLRWIVELALSGQYGPLEVLFIDTQSGFEISPEMLREIVARKPL